MAIDLSFPKLGNRFIDYRMDILGDSYDWGPSRNLSDIKYFFIHHSVTPQEGDWKKEADRIAAEHVSGNGWGGIGYHFVIGSDGIVAYVQDISHGGSSVLNHNDVLISACMVGDFTQQLPTDAQIHSAHDLIDSFLTQMPVLTNLSFWEQVKGHKDAIRIWGDTTVTACPGSSWPVDMYDRIKNNIPYTPTILPPNDKDVIIQQKEVEKKALEEQLTALQQVYDKEQKENVDLNTALEKITGGNKDYATQLLDAQHQNDNYLKDLQAIAKSIDTSYPPVETVLARCVTLQTNQNKAVGEFQKLYDYLFNNFVKKRQQQTTGIIQKFINLFVKRG